MEISLEELLENFSPLIEKITRSKEAVKVVVDGDHDFILMNWSAYEMEKALARQKEEVLLEALKGER